MRTMLKHAVATLLIVLASLSLPNAGAGIITQSGARYFPSSPPPPSGTTIFDCTTSNFVASAGSSSAQCAVGGFSFDSSPRPNGFNANGAGYAVTGGAVFLGDGGNGGHVGIGLTRDAVVDVRKFTATITFVPNGKNFAFSLQNTDNNYFDYDGPDFAAGAGCEAGVYQAFDTDSPNNVFDIVFTQDQPTLNSDGITFTHSNVQKYGYRESPCIPPYTPAWVNPTPAQTVPDKISTSPVALNSPAGTTLTTTNHNYSLTIDYDGSNVKLDLYDITAGGSCPGASCFTHTWTSVNIPSLVGANTAHVGLNGGCNMDCGQNLKINSFKYVDNH